MKTLTRQDLTDLLHGAAIRGAGGGGDLSEGFALIDEALAAGKQFDLYGLDEVPDDALICTPYLLGAISPLTDDEIARYAALPQADTHPILTAYAEFEKRLGKPFFATTACELGGSNTAAAWFPAAMHGRGLLDADPAGRAVPEITHSTYYLVGLPASPIVAANAFGETFWLDGIKDDQRSETLVRALSRESRNDIAAIDHALPMARLRDALIPGTISAALALGQRVRAAHATGEDVAEAIANSGGGRVACRGTVRESTHTTEGGFTLGEIAIGGTGEDAGVDFRIAIKNENMAAWRNGDVVATVPDLICVIDTDTAEPVTNPHARVGQRVAVVFLPAPAAFTTEKGLSVFGPAYAGIDQPYTPAC